MCGHRTIGGIVRILKVIKMICIFERFLSKRAYNMVSCKCISILVDWINGLFDNSILPLIIEEMFCFIKRKRPCYEVCGVLQTLDNRHVKKEISHHHLIGTNANKEITL
jgi:hypothetical protein